MQKVKYILNYLHYFFTACNKHGVHSPFVFDLVTTVINDKRSFSFFNDIEKLRKKLLGDNRKINVTDFGTAFGGKKTYQRKISATAKHSAKPQKYAQLLFRIVNHFKPDTMLELGTSLGISTMYQAYGNQAANFISLEGCEETAKIARENFEIAGLKNIELITGDFKDTLTNTLKKFENLDYVFFDGNHNKEPTLEYFKLCLKKSHEKSIFIFDDINWSDGMKAAWKEVKNHPNITVTIDLFVFGIVFFNPDLTKQDFVIRF